MLGCVVATILVVFLLHRIYIRPCFLSPLRAVPGPAHNAPPIYKRPIAWLQFAIGGSLVEIIREPPYMPQLAWAKKYGGVVCYRGLFGELKLLVSDPDAMRHILVKNPRKYGKPAGLVSRVLAPVVGNGLLTSEGEAHAEQRRRIAPAFHATALRQFAALFRTQAFKLATAWERQLESSSSSVFVEVDFQEAMTRLTLDIIGLASFGYAFNATSAGADGPADDDTETNAVYGAYQKVFSKADLRHVLLRSIPGVAALQRAFEPERSPLDVIRETVGGIIAARRAARRSAAAASGEGGRLQEEEPRDLLDLLLEAADDVNDTELLDQCLTFLVAGHETTAVALTWSVWLLAKNPAAEARLVAELSAHADAGADWSMAGLSQIPFLDAVCRETLRLYPPAPLTSRCAGADDVLPGGQRVPKGTVLFISPGVMGRLPLYWGDNADEFRPERWLSETTETTAETGTPGRRKKKEPFAFLPFLAGERGCIGQRFALLEMKAVLAALLPRFSLACVPGAPEPVPRLQVTLRPTPHLRMHVMRRRQDNKDA